MGGDLVGPSSSTDNAIARFDGTTGKLVQNSAVTVADTTGDIVTAGSVDAATHTASASGTVNAQISSSGASGVVDLDSTGQVRWSSTTAATGSKDTGFGRSAAGVPAATNGVSALYTIGGVLTKNVTSATTAGTSEETLWTYTLPAATLATNTQMVRIKVWGMTAANGNSKTITLKFGSTTLRTHANTGNNVGWYADAIVARTGAATQTANAVSWIGTNASTTGSAPTETLSGTVAIALTATTATAAGDITFQGAIVEFLP